MADLSHFDETGASRMVDVGEKPTSRRIARASGRVRMEPATLARVREGLTKKGNVLEVARLAAIMAAKRTDELIPLCHSLPLNSVTVDFGFDEPNLVSIQVQVTTDGKTGVEMEALTAVSVAALTIYDMCKAMDRGLVIERVQLDEKLGGASGHFQRSEST